MAGVFISFRPEDQAWATRIRASLGSRAAPVDRGRGVNFATALKAGDPKLEAVVLIIGESWLAAVDDPSNPVRIEIEAALKRKMRVIPVLVDGASMPAAGALPKSLKILADLRAIVLDSGHFGSEMSRLQETLSDRPVHRFERPLKSTAAPWGAKPARKAVDKRQATKRAATKAPARKKVSKTATPKGAAKKLAAKTTVARKVNTKKAVRNGATKTAGGKFGRLFDQSKTTFTKEALDELASHMVAAFDAREDGKDDEESGIPALYTYFGQFIDHDLTLDPEPSFKKSKDPTATFDFRTSAFDVDNVYGHGPNDQPYMHDTDKETVAKEAAAKKAASPSPAEQEVASRQPRGAVNQDLSVHEMKHFASARRAKSNRPVGATEDVVECSVFGPPTAPRGETILIQVFLHLTNQAERASSVATTLDPTAKMKDTKSLDLPIKRGARVEVAFSGDGLVVKEPVQSVVWRGEPTYCQFLATIPVGTGEQGFFPVIRVSVDGKLVGRIVFRLSSDDALSQPASEPLGDHSKLYKYAFISYASKDREEVLKRVQMLEVQKQKYFQDVLSLDPGDRWEKKLYENIDRCDLFLLFWSQAAKDSQWVLKEAEYALAHQQKNPGSEPDLVPVVLEQNVLPPPNLSAFHFNDRISYLISRKL
jgi:TIR domain